MILIIIAALFVDTVGVYCMFKQCRVTSHTYTSRTPLSVLIALKLRVSSQELTTTFQYIAVIHLFADFVRFCPTSFSLCFPFTDD